MTDLRDAGTRGQDHIQTITQGYRLVQALEVARTRQSLKALAAAAGMPSWKAYPYLVSFARLGIVVQDPDSLGYKLGPSAAMFGLAAIRQANVITAAPERMQALQDSVQLPVYLSVLGNYGPTVVRKFDWNSTLLVTIKLGHALPLLSSATGAIFLTYTPLSELAELIRQESGSDPDPAAIDAITAETRRTGIAVSRERVNRGFCAVASGVFDHERKLVAAITTLGRVGDADLSFEGKAAELLRQTTADLSRTLGASDRITAR